MKINIPNRYPPANQANKSLPRHPTWEWCRGMLERMGADVSGITSDWCWTSFGKHYPQYLRPFQWLVEGEKDAARRIQYAERLHQFCGASAEWAEQIIREALQQNEKLKRSNAIRHYINTFARTQNKPDLIIHPPKTKPIPNTAEHRQEVFSSCSISQRSRLTEKEARNDHIER